MVEMRTTGIEAARATLADADLAFPTIPERLAAELREQGDWLFSTREIEASPYNLQHYVDEAHDYTDDYAILCHCGHGVNSYALHYYLVFGNLRMFLQLGWGGAYMDNVAATASIAECFKLADQIVAAVDRLPVKDRLTIVASDFYGSYWNCSHSGEKNHSMLSPEKSPLEILKEVLLWCEKK